MINHWFGYFLADAVAVDLENEVTLSSLDGVFTVSYTSPTNELCKFPTISDVVVTSDGIYGEGATLTATITGAVNGPFVAGTHEYQWYRMDDVQGATPEEIVGATSSTYVLQAGDIGFYITCKARFVQTGGTNNKSDWMYSEMTAIITDGAGVGGDLEDIDFAWRDYFNIESGESIPADWNDPGVAVELINLGTGGNWTAAAASKPAYSGGVLNFTKSPVTRVEQGNNADHEAAFEMWMIGTFLEYGTIIGLGSNEMLALTSGGAFSVSGMPNEPGDTDLHIFRTVMNGTSSKFQVDGGTEVTFTQSNSFTNKLLLGCKYTGSNPASFQMKRFYRSPDGVLLSPEEVEAKWAFELAQL